MESRKRNGVFEVRAVSLTVMSCSLATPELTQDNIESSSCLGSGIIGRSRSSRVGVCGCAHDEM